MTYDPAVPQSSQFISTTQPIILNNFNKLNVDFDVDHNPYTTNVGAGNGEHKKITFTNVGSPPYPINTTKSYAYSQFIQAGGTLTYVEYQSAGTDIISGLAPICPMTPRALFRATNPAGFPPQPLVILRSFNIASVIRTASNTFTVTFQESLANANYIVLASSDENLSQLYISPGRAPGSFNLIATAAVGTTLDVMVY